jgi:hypothetical protein
VRDEDIDAGRVPEGLRGQWEAVAGCALRMGTHIGLYTGLFTGGTRVRLSHYSFQRDAESAAAVACTDGSTVSVSLRAGCTVHVLEPLLLSTLTSQHGPADEENTAQACSERAIALLEGAPGGRRIPRIWQVLAANALAAADSGDDGVLKRSDAELFLDAQFLEAAREGWCTAHEWVQVAGDPTTRLFAEVPEEFVTNMVTVIAELGRYLVRAKHVHTSAPSLPAGAGTRSSAVP